MLTARLYSSLRKYMLKCVHCQYHMCDAKSNHHFLQDFSVTCINTSCLVPQNVNLDMLGLECVINAIIIGDLNIIMFLLHSQKLYILILCVNRY
jgi:hypothetical protein